MSQTIDIRCLHLRMTPQATDPIILVINGNEQNIRFVRRDPFRADEQCQYQA